MWTFDATGCIGFKKCFFHGWAWEIVAAVSFFLTPLWFQRSYYFFSLNIQCASHKNVLVSSLVCLIYEKNSPQLYSACLNTTSSHTVAENQKRAFILPWPAFSLISDHEKPFLHRCVFCFSLYIKYIHKSSWKGLKRNHFTNPMEKCVFTRTQGCLSKRILTLWIITFCPFLL